MPVNSECRLMRLADYYSSLLDNAKMSTAPMPMPCCLLCKVKSVFAVRQQELLADAPECHTVL